MIANSLRQWPSFLYKKSGYAPASSTLIDVAGSVTVRQLVLSNTDTTDRLVTITDNATVPNTIYNNIIVAGDMIVKTFDEGLDFTNGIKISAAVASVVYYDIFGFK